MNLLRVRPLETVAALADIASGWEALSADVPFREPFWQLTWWKHFGAAGEAARRRRLFALAVENGNRLVALAPLYVERTLLGGRVLRPLASGAVCSDYLTFLCAAGEETAAAHVAAEYLCTTARGEWDRLDWEAAADNDVALGALFDALTRRGAVADRRSGVSCWRLQLPPTWDEYLALLSKSHRKQLRRLTADVVDTPRMNWHTTQCDSEFDGDWSAFVDLHQRRRRSLGEPGCFADPTFAAFHEDVARQLLGRGRLRLHRLELDGRPIAAEYHFLGGDAVYAYQSGLDPAALADEPGRLAAIAVLRGAIADGLAHYDLLRGDEPYKAHWRAEPTPTDNVSLAAPRATSRLRFELRRRARNVRATLGR